jgi:hypothetical protein
LAQASVPDCLPPGYRLAYAGEKMTIIRGTVKNGQLVFGPDVTEQLGLQEGDAVEVQGAVLTAGRLAENPFAAWIGSLPPLPDGMTAVHLTRELRDDGEEAS